MNKRGTGLLFGIIVAFMIFASGVLVVNLIKGDVDDARTGLNCSDVTISDGAKLTCLGVDLAIPYFIIAFVSIAGGIVSARFL